MPIESAEDAKEVEVENEAAEWFDRTQRVIEWADMHGDDLAGALRLDEDDDAETLSIIDDALWCAWKLARVSFQDHKPSDA